MITVNGIDLKAYTTVFPDKTIQVWKLPPELLWVKQRVQKIVWHWTGDHTDYFTLRQYMTLLASERGRLIVEEGDEFDYTFELLIPFVPYARQDKFITNNATFGLDSFLGCLGGIVIDYETEAGSEGPYGRIVTIDMHNPEPFLIHQDWYEAHGVQIHNARLDVFELQHRVLAAHIADGREFDRVVMVAGDSSVPGRLVNWDKLPPEQRYVMPKVREPLTGQLIQSDQFDEYNNQQIHENCCDVLAQQADGRTAFMVVDDLCDGGATFCNIGETIAEFNERRGLPSPRPYRVKPQAYWGLFVTHGLFSKSLTPLWPYYTLIRTSDTLGVWHQQHGTLPAWPSIAMTYERIEGGHPLYV